MTPRIPTAARLAAVVLVVCAAACAAPELPPDVEPFEAVGDSAEPGGRADDLELAPGPDLEVTSVAATSIEDFEAESEIAGNELSEALSEDVEGTTGVQPRLFSSIGKVVISIPRSIPRMVLAGGFMRNAGIFGGKNLYVPTGSALATDNALVGKVLYAFGSQACTKPGSALVAVPSAQATRLVAKFGGKPSSYTLCVASTYVDKASGAKSSVRTYLDKRSSPPKPVAVRVVSSTTAKTTVLDIPKGVF